MPRHFNMPDPTEPAIIATLSAALGIFTITAIARKWLGKNEPITNPAPDLVPFESSTQPPPFPVKGVPTWFYNSFDLLGLGFIYLAFSGLIITSLRMPETSGKVIGPTELVSSIGFQLIIAGIVTAFVITRVRPMEWLGLKWQRWPLVFLIAPAAVFLMWMILGGLGALGYMKWIESLGVEAMQDSVKLLQETKDPIVLALIVCAAVIAAPICEEIVFRGYFYPAAKKFAGPWVAAICSALVFSAAHGSLVALLPIFILGCLLVFIYEKTGSLWATIAVHFCFNGATVGLQLAARYFNIPLDPTP
jgi:membrane protease YdiL (CAAX protease family)